jgi:hypothetical protein
VQKLGLVTVFLIDVDAADKKGSGPIDIAATSPTKGAEKDGGIIKLQTREQNKGLVYRRTDAGTEWYEKQSCNKELYKTGTRDDIDGYQLLYHISSDIPGHPASSIRNELTNYYQCYGALLRNLSH